MTPDDLEKASSRLAKAFRSMDIEFGALAQAEQRREQKLTDDETPFEAMLVKFEDRL